MSTHFNSTLEVILAGQKQRAWMENTSVAISISWMSSFKPQCLWACVTMQPRWHYQRVCIHFRAELWSAPTSQARWSPVLLNNTRLHGCVYVPLRLQASAQSHPEHLWYSGSLEPATHLRGSVTHQHVDTQNKSRLLMTKILITIIT